MLILSIIVNFYINFTKAISYGNVKYCISRVHHIVNQTFHLLSPACRECFCLCLCQRMRELKTSYINRYFAYDLSLHHFRYLPQFLSIFLLDCLPCGFHSDSIRHKANKSKDLPSNLDSLQFDHCQWSTKGSDIQIH